MIVFPNCKINLGLRILNKRPDGFHNLETVFYPVQWKDALEILPAEGGKGTVDFTSSGLPIAGKPEDNLCLKAYELLKKEYPELPLVRIHLHKAIPMGAGLGGGSSDGSFTLKALNNIFKLNITSIKLKEYSLTLGSDCPFFLENKPCLATGRGECLEPIDFSLKGYQLLLVNPGIHINTGWAFSRVQKGLPGQYKPLKAIISSPVREWKKELVNDFEQVAIEEYPVLEQIRNQLYDAGALYAAMSGSGSTFFGIFNENANPEIEFPSNYSVHLLKISQ